MNVKSVISLTLIADKNYQWKTFHKLPVSQLCNLHKQTGIYCVGFSAI